MHVYLQNLATLHREHLENIEKLTLAQYFLDAPHPHPRHLLPRFLFFLSTSSCRVPHPWLALHPLTQPWDTVASPTVTLPAGRGQCGHILFSAWCPALGCVLQPPWPPLSSRNTLPLGDPRLLCPPLHPPQVPTLSGGVPGLHLALCPSVST